MQEIVVGRYAKPENVGGWQGYVEPKDKSWIVFIDKDGRPVLFAHREQPGGGCIGPAAVIPSLEEALAAEESYAEEAASPEGEQPEPIPAS